MCSEPQALLGMTNKTKLGPQNWVWPGFAQSPPSGSVPKEGVCVSMGVLGTAMWIQGESEAEIGSWRRDGVKAD